MWGESGWAGREDQLREVVSEMAERQVDNWQDFWDGQDLFPEVFWQKNMKVFLRESDRLMNYTRHDRVLDIGCGYGFLERGLQGRVALVHGLDLAEHFVAECRQRFADTTNVQIDQLTEDYTDLSVLPADASFTKIVCVGVVQYYRSAEDILKLVESVREVAAEGARLLVADILLETTIFEDVRELLRVAFREGMLGDTFQFIWRARMSDYHRLRREVGLLMFSREELEALAGRIDARTTILTDRLTVNTNRAHLLIRF